MKKRIPEGQSRAGGEGRSAVVWIVAAVYLVLTIAASSCMLLHSASHHSEGHHSDSDKQSSLCTWACQIASQSGLTASGPTEMSDLVAAVSAVPASGPVLFPSAVLLPSRAPPLPVLG
jgi:hypothetical protein